VLKYLILTICVLAVLAFTGAMAWLAGTTDGARWLLATFSRHSGLDISAKAMEGKIAGTLKISHLSIRWPQGWVNIERASLSASPTAMLTGNLHLQTVTLKNITIADNEPSKPPEFRWPKVSGWLSWLGGSIDRLDIEDLTYRHEDKQPLKFAKINASLNWSHGYLSVKKLTIFSDFASVSGNIRAGFSRPLLDMNIAMALSRPVAEMRFFRLTGKLTPATSPEQIAGNLHLTGSKTTQDTAPLWTLSLDAALTSQGIPLRKIRLTRSDSRGALSGEGMLTSDGINPRLSLKAEAKDIDWTFGMKVPTRLSGSFFWEGTAKQYNGYFSFVNAGKAWQNIRLAGNFSGDDETAKINIQSGSAMNGSVTGHLNFDWREGLAIDTELYGRNLNPSIIEKDWTGQINFDLTGKIQMAEHKTPHGELYVLLKQSHLHGQPLTGNLQATFADNDYLIQDLALRGKGFQIQASGTVNNRLDFVARIGNLSNLAPETSGSLTARGWMRYDEGKLSGAFAAQAANLAAGDLSISVADIKAALGDSANQSLNVQATLQKLRYRQFQADALTLHAEGTPVKHTATATFRAGSSNVHLALTGSYRANEWRGNIFRLEGQDGIGPWHLAQPSVLILSSSGLTLDALMLTGSGTESIRASCRLTRTPLSGFILLDWNGVNLQRVGAWLNQTSMTGITRGSLHLNFLPQNRLALAGKAFLQGTFNVQGKTIGIRQALLSVDADTKGTHADLNVTLTGGGTLKGIFSSATPADFSIPDEGRFNLELQDFDPALLGPILPKPVRIEGKIAAQADGRLLPDHRVTMKGRVSSSESRVRILGQKSDINIDLKEAAINWMWQDDALSGNALLKLSEYGKLEVRFRIPVAARLPVTFDEKGILQASLSGGVQEKGALTALFPALIQESRGRLDLDLRLNGTWKEPYLSGDLRLSKAGGYLPSAGITIKDAGFSARFTDNVIFVDSISALSGPGHVEGKATIRLKEGKISGFEGYLNGDHFQTIYFPELQIQSSPKLSFSGTPEKITVAGEILLPNVSIIGTQSSRAAGSSPDVIREGKTRPAPGKLPFDLDARINVILGDSVLFKVGGIDAQLGGNVDVQFQELDKIFSRGEIRVTKGRFQTYGVNLDIVRGRLNFTGGPVNQPILDILALKKIGDIKAGVTVTGKLQSPLIKLYSDPAMQDMDILAYIVLGHPLGSNTEQANLLAVAAGALLSSRQAEGMQSQIKNRLGLSSFDISAGVVEKSGRMGYKPVKVTSPATGTSVSTESVGETMVVIGRYLTPKIYVSYGRSLFTGSNLFSLRYNLSPNWQVESQTGSASGVDIYYKLEFN